MYDAVASSLETAFQAGSAFLVTGAGFSYGAVNVDGEPVPSARRLAELFFATYSTDDLPDDASLGEVFDLASLRDADAVDAVIKRKLRVDPEADLPASLPTYLQLPWARIYTFNLDDLVEVGAMHTGAAITSASALITVPAREINYVHVNGDLDDGRRATFSERQYAERLARRDPWLMTMGAELLSGTVVYVGTTIRELHLWTAIEARRLESSGALDPRPASYLVSPHIDATRREMLAYSRVEWLESGRDDFAEAVLRPLAAAHRTTKRTERVDFPWWHVLEPVLDPARAESRYLLGQEPTWNDVQYLAVARRFESELSVTSRQVLVITGTPGAGKTTSAMKVALARRADGHRVRFIDVEDVDSYRDILTHVRKERESFDLVIDNAELLGSWLPSIANEFTQKEKHGELVVVASKMRIGALRLGELRDEAVVVEVPLLDPTDVAGLVTVLDRHGMLGHLEGKARADQEDELSSRSGRQLLVAMIRATRGEDHETRVAREYESLGGEERAVYGLVSLARETRYRLGQPDLLLAAGKEAVIPLEKLLEAGTVVRRAALVQPRHARIAEIVVATMRRRGELLEAWTRLTQGLAVSHDIENRYTRVTRAITRLISHDETRARLGLDGGRQFYANVQDHLRADYHYWLQRGSFELGTYDGLVAARRFLEASRARSGGDPFVEVAWGDLLFAEALAASPEQRDMLGRTAFTHVSGLFGGFGRQNPYPFGVAAKGCIRIASSPGLLRARRKSWLKQALDDVLDEGIRQHPSDGELSGLRRQALEEFARARRRIPRRSK